MAKKGLIFIAVFVSIFIFGAVKSEAIGNMPSPSASVSAQGIVSASWQACTSPDLFEYTVMYGCNGCETFDYTASTSSTSYTFSQPAPTNFEKVSVAVLAQTSGGSVIPSCVYPSTTVANPTFPKPSSSSSSQSTISSQQSLLPSSSSSTVTISSESSSTSLSTSEESSSSISSSTQSSSAQVKEKEGKEVEVIIISATLVSLLLLGVFYYFYNKNNKGLTDSVKKSDNRV